METKQSPRYSVEFKQQAVELAEHSGSIMQTARDLGIDQSTLRKWVKIDNESGFSVLPGSGNPRDKELATLKKKLYDLEQENAILKKAVGIFAPRSR